MDAVYTLSVCTLRLLARDTRRLLTALCIPILAGLVLGLASRATGLSSIYGLLMVLALSALLPLVPQSIRAHGLPMDVRIKYASRAVTRLLILAVQVLLYIGVMFPLGAGVLPGPGVLAGAIMLSVIVGLTADRLGI